MKREVKRGTQYYTIIKKLQRKKGLSSFEAFIECGTVCLPRRISDLRSMGYKISDEWAYRYDGGKVVSRWKVYRLVA